jgi:hypothetical protein
MCNVNYYGPKSFFHITLFSALRVRHWNVCTVSFERGVAASVSCQNAKRTVRFVTVCNTYTKSSTRISLQPPGVVVIISGSTVFVRTLAASHLRFRNLIKTQSVRLFCTCDRPVATSPIHNTRAQRQTSVPRTQDPSKQAAADIGFRLRGYRDR